jgi:hypothetical protein
MGEWIGWIYVVALFVTWLVWENHDLRVQIKENQKEHLRQINELLDARAAALGTPLKADQGPIFGEVVGADGLVQRDDGRIHYPGDVPRTPEEILKDIEDAQS